MRAWLLILLVGACDQSRPSAPEVCKSVCRRLSSCPGAGPYESCVAGFHCEEQTNEVFADCEWGCLQSHASCDDAYERCRSTCLHPCAASCAGGCAADEACFGGLIPNTTVVSLAAACRKKCNTTDDCQSGEHCVLDPSIYGQTAGRVCLPEKLVRCDGSRFGDCEFGARCDGDTLQKVYFDSSTECGVEFVHCANGCDGAPAVDGASTAMCK